MKRRGTKLLTLPFIVNKYVFHDKTMEPTCMFVFVLRSSAPLLIKQVGQICFLVRKNFSSVLYQPSCQLPTGSRVVDETCAGDCYRAGFAVALLQKQQGDE